MWKGLKFSKIIIKIFRSSKCKIHTQVSGHWTLSPCQWWMSSFNTEVLKIILTCNVKNKTIHRVPGRNYKTSFKYLCSTKRGFSLWCSWYVRSWSHIHWQWINFRDNWLGDSKPSTFEDLQLLGLWDLLLSFNRANDPDFQALSRNPGNAFYVSSKWKILIFSKYWFKILGSVYMWHWVPC